MARYQHLPIYADAYRLALHVELQVLGFAAKHRPAIGFKCRNAATCDSPGQRPGLMYQ